MEHIVQIAVSVDDDAIVRIITEKAAKEITEELKQQVTDKLFQPSYYSRHANPDRDRLSDFTRKLVGELLEENKDTIIEKAADNLADRLARTKKAKSFWMT